MLIRLAHGYEVEVTNDGPRQMGDFQHWTPSEDVRIRLVSRESGSKSPIPRQVPLRIAKAI